MDPEVEIVEEEGSDADFESGFETEVTPTTTPAVTDSTELVEEVAPVVAATPAAPSTEDQITQLMKRVEEGDAFRADAQKKFDSAFGKLGGLQQTIERIQGATPKGQSVEITDQDFTELRAEFPELAAMQIKGLKAVLSRLTGTSAAAPPMDINALVSQGVKTALHERDIEALDEVIPNWTKEINTPAYSQWIAAQPIEVQKLGASDVPKDARRLLTLFRDRPKKPAVSSRQRLLETAAVPNTSRGASVRGVEEDEFEAGFNSR